jgi:hypothetical protein
MKRALLIMTLVLVAGGCATSPNDRADRAGRRAEQRSDQHINREIDRTVDRVFDGIFRR